MPSQARCLLLSDLVLAISITSSFHAIWRGRERVNHGLLSSWVEVLSSIWAMFAQMELGNGSYCKVRR